MTTITRFTHSVTFRFVLAICACLVFGAWLDVKGFNPSRKIVEGSQPLPAYTVVALKKDYIGVRPDGSQISSQGSIVAAFRSDGSSAIWEDSFSSDPETAPFGHVHYGRLVFPASHSSVKVFPDSESVTTFFLPKLISPPRLRHKCEASANQPGIILSDSDPASLLGYRVVRLSSVSQDTGGEEFVREDWQAPDLNCGSLRLVFGRRDAQGKTRVLQTVEATMITPGEPDPKLFEVPANYTERSPSEAWAEFARRLGVPAPPPNRGLETADQNYRDSRKYQ
jgi:hypothetical protein